MSSDQDPGDMPHPIADTTGNKQSLINEINLLRKSGDAAKAVAILEELLVQTPNDVALLKELAHARFSIRDDRGAIEALDRLRQIKPLGKLSAQLHEQVTRRLMRQEA